MVAHNAPRPHARRETFDNQDCRNVSESQRTGGGQWMERQSLERQLSGATLPDPPVGDSTVYSSHHEDLSEAFGVERELSESYSMSRSEMNSLSDHSDTYQIPVTSIMSRILLRQPVKKQGQSQPLAQKQHKQSSEEYHANIFDIGTAETEDNNGYNNDSDSQSGAYGAETTREQRKVNQTVRRRRWIIGAIFLMAAMAIGAAVVSSTGGGGNSSASSSTSDDNNSGSSNNSNNDDPPLFDIPNNQGSNSNPVTTLPPRASPRPTRSPVTAPQPQPLPTAYAYTPTTDYAYTPSGDFASFTLAPVAQDQSLQFLPKNNDCENAIGPLTIHGPTTVGSTDNATISLSDQTPVCGQVVSNGQGVWYHVTGGDEVIRASTCHSDPQATFDTQLSIFSSINDYSGNNCGDLQCIAGSDEFCGSQSSASWYAEKGVRYYIYVHGWGDASGTFFLSVDYEENGSCETAIGPLDLTTSDSTSITTGSLRGASMDKFLSCDAVQVNNGVVWYSVYGTGSWMEASTCHDVTEFAARIAVVSGGCSNIQCAAARDSDCGTNGYRAIWKSNPGDLYHILVFKENNFRGTLLGLSVQEFEPVANDECQAAVMVTSNSGSNNLVLGSTLRATIDNAPSQTCGEFNLQPGVWFLVQGTGGKLLASTCNQATNFATEIAIFKGDCGSLVCITGADQFCGNKASVYWDTVAGETYSILVHGSDYGLVQNIGDFGLTVDEFVPEENDACESAIPLDPSGDRMLGSTFFATDDGASRCVGIQSYGPGVWYSVQTTVGTVLRASTCDPETDFDTQISIFRGSCGSLTCVITDDNSCGLQSSVAWSAAAGIDYYIFVHGREKTSSGDFTLTVEEYSPAVSNDFCGNAVALPSDGSRVTGSTQTASFDNVERCVVDNTGPGVWYIVEGTGTAMEASLCDEATTYDSAISIFSGDCLNLACVAGNRNGVSQSCGSKSQVTWVSALDATYYILVHGWGTRSGEFGLTVREPPSAVSNDFCVRAGALSISSTVIMGSTVNATVDATPTCSDVVAAAPGVWYQVTGNGNMLRAATCNAKGSSLTDFDTQISVFRGGCGNLECAAADDNGCGLQSRAIWASVADDTYYIHVHGARGRSGNYGLVVDNFVSQQANDACSAAQGPLMPDGTVVQGSTADASFDDVGFCGTSNVGPGVWFYFVGTGERLTADTCNEITNFDTKISIFSGFDCSGLTCVDGIDDGCGLQSSISFDTQVGESYWLLLHGWETNNVGRYGLTLSGSNLFGSLGGL